MKLCDNHGRFCKIILIFAMYVCEFQTRNCLTVCTFYNNTVEMLKFCEGKFLWILMVIFSQVYGDIISLIFLHY